MEDGPNFWGPLRISELYQKTFFGAKLRIFEMQKEKFPYVAEISPKGKMNSTVQKWVKNWQKWHALWLSGAL